MKPGQTLIETIVTMAVAVIIIAALVGMAVTSLRSSSLSRSRALASQLLVEETERARIYRDANGLSGLEADIPGGLSNCPTVSSHKYFPAPPAAPVSGDDTSISTYTRYFTACRVINGAGQTEMIKITAVVSWTDSSGTHPIKSTTYLSNWR